MSASALGRRSGHRTLELLHAHASRATGAIAGYRWARRALRQYRSEIREAGLTVAVLPPASVRRGTLRGARAALRRDRATCLERSLIIQRWWASNGVALEVLVGVRLPGAEASGADATAHAWVDRWDADCSDRYAVIRRVPAPDGAPPRTPAR